VAVPALNAETTPPAVMVATDEGEMVHAPPEAVEENAPAVPAQRLDGPLRVPAAATALTVTA